jgi:molecular chaperone GrpE
MSNRQAETELVEENLEGLEPDTVEADSSLPAGEISSVQERIAQLEQELQTARDTQEDYYNRMLRIQADFDNFRRRSRQELEQLSLYGGEDLLKKILPVLDSLERAINCFNDNSGGWQEGVQLTLKQFQNILNSEGLEPVTALNETFDPQVHEAVLQEESEAVEAPTVVAELQKGYKFKSKLLRPALVKVAVPKL